MASRIGLVIHGGAGTILRNMMTPEMEKEYKEGLANSLEAGFAVLSGGGSSLDAVQAAVNVMEDCPLFNAGKGAVFTHEGTNEQDATIMDGRTMNSGGVAGVRHVANPINLARLVMDKSEHILLACDGAEAFARAQGMELVEDKYFYTDLRWRQLQNALRREQESQKTHTQMDHTPDDKHGTVGAVALDREGNLAAATSSGGMTNKRFTRLGDSPIVGAGTYANNATCAVSCTGHGEYFITASAAFHVHALMEYQGMSVEEAARVVIHDKITKLGGTGGLIAIDRNCSIALPFNTDGMYRGHRLENENPVVAIFKD